MDQNNMRLFGTLFTGSLIRKLCFLSFLFLSINSAALDDGTWTYELVGDNVEVTGCYSACSKDLVIPNTIAGKSVTIIGAEAFRAINLASVIIPNNVITIGHSAFYGNNLASVIIPNNVITIGGWAFRSNQLTSLIIGSSVTNIGAVAFEGNQLFNVTIPDSVLSIGEDAFKNNIVTDNGVWEYYLLSDNIVISGYFKRSLQAYF